MTLALTEPELSFQRRVRAFAEKTPTLAAKIEAEEYFPSDFLRALSRSRFLGAPFSYLTAVPAQAGFPRQF